MFGNGKYRVRTWVRGWLPWRLTWLAPKGPDDCGNHEWYRRDDENADCYHCELGHRRLEPGQRIADLYADAEAPTASREHVPA
jgi:hypothetical protein